jgi:3',5'-cyclic AMP phosphodiesterase CpdA
MLVAQITDFHVTPRPSLYYGRLDTRETLARAIARIETFTPRIDLVVGTGDLVDKPSEASYAELRGLLARLTIPVRLIPGNHDDRALLAAAFPDHPYLAAERVNYAVDFDEFRLVAFDAVVAGKEYAAPTPESLDWLGRTLAEAPDRPTMNIMHHPPVDIGMAFVDALQKPWPPEFAALIRASPQVRLIACGHAHRVIDAALGMARIAVAGSAAHQFVLATDIEEPPSMVFEPPMLRLHLWRGGEVVSHLVPVAAEFERVVFKGAEPEAWVITAAKLKPRLARPRG